MWYRIAKEGVASGAIKTKPDISQDMIKFLLDQGRSIDEFYINSKLDQSEIWDSLNNGARYPTKEPLPIYQTLEDQLEDRHYEEDTVNMLQVEKGKGGMYMKNGEGFTQYNSGKTPTVFYDNLPFNKTLV
jgi:hypothetical protein